MPIQLYRGQPVTVTIDFPSDPLVPFGAALSDITETYVGLKRNTASDADDKYLQVLTAGFTNWDLGAFAYAAVFSQDDTDISPDDYELVLAVKIPAHAKRIELQMPDPDVTIVADKSRA